jgi:hypothetical protein
MTAKEVPKRRPSPVIISQQLRTASDDCRFSGFPLNGILYDYHTGAEMTEMGEIRGLVSQAPAFEVGGGRKDESFFGLVSRVHCAIRGAIFGDLSL